MKLFYKPATVIVLTPYKILVRDSCGRYYLSYKDKPDLKVGDRLYIPRLTGLDSEWHYLYQKVL